MKTPKLKGNLDRFLHSIFQIFIVVLLGERNQEASSGQVFRRCSGGRCE